MSDEIQQVFDLIDDMRRRADVNVAFGPPISAEGQTVIPVANVTYALNLNVSTGSVSGKSAEEAGAKKEGSAISTTGGSHAHPLGVVELAPDGVYVTPVIDRQRVTLASIFLAGWISFWVTATLIQFLNHRRAE